MYWTIATGLFTVGGIVWDIFQNESPTPPLVYGENPTESAPKSNGELCWLWIVIAIVATYFIVRSK